MGKKLRVSPIVPQSIPKTHFERFQSKKTASIDPLLSCPKFELPISRILALLIKRARSHLFHSQSCVSRLSPIPARGSDLFLRAGKEENRRAHFQFLGIKFMFSFGGRSFFTSYFQFRKPKKIKIWRQIIANLLVMLLPSGLQSFFFLLFLCNCFAREKQAKRHSQQYDQEKKINPE